MKRIHFSVTFCILALVVASMVGCEAPGGGGVGRAYILFTNNGNADMSFIIDGTSLGVVPPGGGHEKVEVSPGVHYMEFKFTDGKVACSGGQVTAVRGRGLMLGLVLDQPAKPLVDLVIEEGLLCLATAETVVRFLPPLNVKDDELAEALDILDDCLAEWHGVGAE